MRLVALSYRQLDPGTRQREGERSPVNCYLIDGLSEGVGLQIRIALKALDDVSKVHLKECFGFGLGYAAWI